MQNLESIDWSTYVKFYVGVHFSTLFYTLSTIANVFTQPALRADGEIATSFVKRLWSCVAIR